MGGVVRAGFLVATVMLGWHPLGARNVPGGQSNPGFANENVPFSKLCVVRVRNGMLVT